jgi:hypothetical protein
MRQRSSKHDPRCGQYQTLMSHLRALLATAPPASLEEFRLDRAGGWLIAGYTAFLNGGETKGQTWLTAIEVDPATQQLHLRGTDPDGDPVCLGLWDRLPGPEDLPLPPSNHCATLVAEPTEGE